VLKTKSTLALVQKSAGFIMKKRKKWKLNEISENEKWVKCMKKRRD